MEDAEVLAVHASSMGGSFQGGSCLGWAVSTGGCVRGQYRISSKPNLKNTSLSHPANLRELLGATCSLDAALSPALFPVALGCSLCSCTFDDWLMSVNHGVWVCLCFHFSPGSHLHLLYMKGPLCFAATQRGFMVWTEMQKGQTKPLQSSAAVLPLFSPLLREVPAVQFPPASSHRTDPLHLTVVWYPWCSCSWLVGCLGSSVFLLASAEMLHFWNEVCCLHVKWHGAFSQLSWQPQAWRIAGWRAAKGKHSEKKLKKKIPCGQLPELGARLIRTPHCLSETNVLIKSIVVGLDGTKCYWVTSQL